MTLQPMCDVCHCFRSVVLKEDLMAVSLDDLLRDIRKVETAVLTGNIPDS